MPSFLAYPNSQNTPNRKQRKAKRRSTFAHNKVQAAVERRARRDARKEKSNDTIK